MTTPRARNIFDLPSGLPGEYALLWAVIECAKRDAGIVARSGRTHYDPDLQAEARQFLDEFLQLRGELAACA